MVIITPIIKRLKELGYYIILNTGQRGKTIFQHDDRIDEFIDHDDNTPVEGIVEVWEKLKKDVPHDYFCNFSESIECNLALHPINPMYIYPKNERAELCNRNYYDVTKKWSKVEGKIDDRPSLQFTDKEVSDCNELLDKKAFNILWCLSGSGKNKVYPWTDYVIGEVLKNYPDTKFVTVGDQRCQILETKESDRVLNLSGRVSVRRSMCLTGLVDLVISPDTGVLHASGCYTTPKIGLLGHTTKENITKYFLNDYSLEAGVDCSPCFRLVYDYEVQCPIDPITKAAWCMSVGLDPERTYARIKEVIEAGRVRKELTA